MASSIRQRFGFAAPMAPMAALNAPMLATIPALYAKYAPIGLAQIAIGMFVLRLLDVVLDPLIGVASDRTPTRWGHRKPWIVAGLLGAMPTAYFWFRPGPATGLLHFLGWTASASLCWAMVSIPHGAWVGDLSTDHDDRVALSFWRTEALYVGGIAFAAVPLLPFLPSTALTPGALAAGSWGVIAGLAMALGALLIWAPAATLVKRAPRRESHRAMWRAVLGSRPLRILILVIATANIASGMVAALYFFFVDDYLGLLDRLAYVSLGTFAVALAVAPLWPAVIRRIGCPCTMAVGLGTTALTVLAMAFLPRHGTAFVGLAALFAVDSALAVGVDLNVVTMSADAADHGGDGDRAGLFFAACTIVEKAGIAVGGATALLIASRFGFDPKAGNGAAAMRGFFLAFTVLPFILYAVGAALALRFPRERPARP